jgi:DNA-binding transcriptional ArsR family regulator
MSIGRLTEREIELEVVSGSACALLVALASASALPGDELPSELATALRDVGAANGEPWLNLFGVPLDAGPPYSVERLLAALGSLDAVELRRHLLGRYAWSWCTLAGIDDLESAAAGDGAATRRLLAHPRYYGGHAASSLGVLLALDPDETPRRIVQAVESGARSLLAPAASLELEIAEQAASSALATQAPLAAIERLATGYRYVPEPEADRVVLIPHLEPDLPLILAQHRASRLIVYRAQRDRSREESLIALGRALADPKRVEILGLVGRGVGSASDLVAETGLSRSTVHHHLAQLREVGLVGLEGNARAYRYVPRPAAAAGAAELVAEVIGAKEER